MLVLVALIGGALALGNQAAGAAPPVPSGADTERAGNSAPRGAVTMTATLTPGPSPTCAPNLNPTWVAGTPAPPPGRYNAAGVVGGDGNFYIVGGFYDVTNLAISTTLAYQPASDSWITRAPLPTPRANAAIGTLGDRIYVAGGDLSGGSPTLPDVHIYDVTSDTWTSGAPLPEERSGAVGWGFAPTNRFYVFGGDTSAGNQTTTFIYNPISNTWTTGASLPGAKSDGAVASDGTYIYLAGGYDNTSPTGALFRYDPMADSWATLTPDPVIRFRPGMSFYDGKLYVTGGSTGFYSPPLNTVSVYNIALGTWSQGQPLLATRVAHVQGTLNDGRIIVATGLSPSTIRSTTVELLPPPQTCATPSATPTPIPASPTATPTATVTATACTLTFNDVAPNSTFYPWIRCLACRGIVGGYPCGGPGEPCPGAYFRPNNNVTRGQVSKIVSESAAFSDPVPSTQQTFEDVPPSGTFWLWVERLSTRGIISGYPCGGPFEPCIGPDNRPYFRPNNNVTRGQLSKITGGAAGWTETPTGQTFEDVPPGQTFYLTIERMAARGIISGYPCGGPFEPCVGPANRPYFRPNNNATRGQMSKIAAEAFYPNCQTPAAGTARLGPPSGRVAP
jgi:hypothetical protein